MNVRKYFLLFLCISFFSFLFVLFTFTTLDAIYSSSSHIWQHEYFELYFPLDFKFPNQISTKDANQIPFIVNNYFDKEQKTRYRVIQKDSMNEIVLLEDHFVINPKQELRKEISLQNLNPCDRCAIQIVLPEQNTSIQFWTSIL
ncbi:MAG: hypothetical protein N3A54_02780 [Patescibacteria group bacterium]|nr:hypothetical protein [Patescibacteria group bacterium]